MKIMNTLLSATCVLSLAATGCIKQDAPPEGIAKAIPTNDQVAIKLPANAARLDAPALGQLSTYYVTTRGVTQTFNGGSAWALILVHTIVQYPVTSVSGNTYTWGPWSGNALDPAIYKLDVTANGDGTFDYTLSGHAKSDATNHFLAVIDGHADPRPGELLGNGSFLLDFEAARTVNPIDNANNKGQVDVHYDLAAKHLDLMIISTDANGQPASADYSYDETAGGGGNMTFSVLANVGGTAAAETATIRSRWLGTGAGRGDARISGGDLGSAQALASECWSTAFTRVYYTDNVNFAATEGDVAQCAFATADLPQ
ncbi:MAG: uncharacterized protein JWO36_2275 [Myxococcales bacterium]|nr:uncharacterized protein [Myxococcales bacterium]